MRGPSYNPTYRILRILTGAVGAMALAATGAWGMSLWLDDSYPVQPERELAVRASNLGIEVPDNEQVRSEIRRLVFDPAGHETMRRAFVRRDRVAATIQEALAREGVPPALEAIALVESGYKSFGEGGPARAAGVWQFVEMTAEKYGLIVNLPQRDDRRDLRRSSFAAARYLRDTAREFHGDWHLAIAAYNVGWKGLRDAMAISGTEDPWELMHRGRIPKYLATVLAGIAALADHVGE